MKNLNNNQLVLKLKNLCAEERKLTAQVLDHLREVERRKLFLEMGYNSLFEFCMKELGYCESSAQRRVAAMRLIKELPIVEEKIVTGELSLSVVSQVQNFFKRQEKKSVGLKQKEKLELLTQLEHTSTRECEKVLLKLDPEPLHQDIEKSITEDLTEIRLTVDKIFTDKLEKLKNLLSNAHPDLNTKDLLNMSLDFMLQKTDPGLQKNNHLKSKTNLELKQNVPKNSRSAQNMASPLKPISEKSKPILNAKMIHHARNITATNNKDRRYIPGTIKQEVWFKSEGQCCYKNPKTDQRCSGRRFLHYDHIIPISKGGRTTVDNIQLLCSNHNLWKSNRVL